jgi:enoyl-CoA hydratase/carnithine racemase
MTENVKSSTDNGICILTIARPKAKNAFSIAMYAGLMDAVKAADADPAVDVIVLRGEGGNFSSGNDLKDFLQNPPTGPESTVFQFMHAVADLTKPIIAQVEGFAVGIGSTILLHCDLVYASETAKLTLPFVNLGLVPEAASSFFLPRLVGHQRASEILFFGEPFDAATACSLGLVNQVVPSDRIDAFVYERARTLAEKPADALRATKALLKKHWHERMLTHLDEEARVFCRLLREPNCHEAIHAFFEKRKPSFRKG